MGWFRKVLGLSNVAAEQKADTALSFMIPSWQEGTAGQAASSFPNAVKFGYRLNELIFSTISIAANATASVALKVYSGDDEQPDHPLRQLITKPNPFMTEFDFWSATVVLRKLSGHAYWQVMRSKAGIPVQLWPLRTDWVRPIRTGKGVVGYEYGPGSVEPVTIRVEDVVDFNVLDPMDILYGGQAPVMVAARVVDVDNDMTDFLKAFFRQGAMPAGLLSTKTKLTDAMAADIRRRWGERYGGWSNWMDPAVLDSDATYQRLGLTFDEMGFASLDARSETRICMVMGVPPILVGAMVGLEHGTYSNYEQARKAWWEDFLFPDFQHLKGELELALLPEFSGVTLGWDFAKVPALQESQEQVIERTHAGWVDGAVLKNEYRAALGLPPVNGGDVFRIAPGSSELPVGQIAISAGNDGMTDGSAKALPGPSEAHAAPVAENAPDDEQRRKRERELEEKLIEHYDDFLQRVKREARALR